MPPEADLKETLRSSALAPRAAEILALARAGVQLIPDRTDMDALPMGSSRLGGVPDLPAGTDWPLWNGEPQSFIAQLRLDEFGQLPGADVLPREGSLLFFYSARQDTWGFDPNDRGSWRTIHAPAGAALVRSAPPATIPDGGSFEPCALTSRSVLTLPPWDSRQVERLGLSSEEGDAYADLVDALHDEDMHRLLGFPDQVQGDMAAECQLVTHGLYTGDASGWNDPRAEALSTDAEDWRLLLQVASDDASRMMWGDAGFIYYWIRSQDLAARAFEQTWLILQCG